MAPQRSTRRDQPLLVSFVQTVCLPIGPRCSRCTLSVGKLCRIAKVGKTTRKFLVLLGTSQNLETCHRSLLRSLLQPRRRGTCMSSEQSIPLPANSIHTLNHPACFPWYTYKIGPRPTKRVDPRSVLQRRLGSTILVSPFPRARTQVPDLTPRGPTCRLGTDTRGATPHGVPLG